MSTANEPVPAAEQAKQYISMCKNRLIKTLSFVPEDKLSWSPSAQSKSPLRIAAHCGCSNGSFLKIISGEKIPEMSRQEMLAYTEAAEGAIETREQAIDLIEESTAALVTQLDAITAEQVGAMIETPMFTAPMVFWMNLPGRHMDNHASQIDYLQTCWGDMDWHI